MDNRIFNVNGEGEQMLLDTLKLVFTQEGDNTTCKAWKQTDEHGLLLLWWHEDRDKTNPFPAPMTAEQCLPFVTAWLKSDAAKKVKLDGWDASTDHVGSNGAGWRVYCEDWGHVAGRSDAICAIKPVVLWFGK